MPHDELIARLLATRSIQHTVSARDDDDPVPRVPINPDGPEAAEALTTMQAREATLIRERDALAAENDRLSKAVCSGILGELLTDDENEALVGFVKNLRREALGTSGLATAPALQESAACTSPPPSQTS
jgi:hypothetical protein